MDEQTETLKKTVLADEHMKLKAKMVNFGGWYMPVSYEGVLAEHHTVRTQCGLFDVSHMGEIRVTGADAENFLQYLTINDINRLAPGLSQYSALLNFEGGMIDDIIIYRIEESDFMICVNASNIEKDFAWIQKIATDFDVSVINQSSQWSQLAVQGPTSMQVLKEILSKDDAQILDKTKFTQFFDTEIFGEPSFVARTGYTGEKGYELYVPNKITTELWQRLLSTSARTGIKPIGLGARDTLRLEACYLLYGNDMNEQVSPLEAGIEWVIRWDCGEFVGKDALEKQNIVGLEKTMMAIVMEDQGIPRHDMEIFASNKSVGRITSGSVFPTVGGAGGLALINPNKVTLGDKVEVDVRGKRRLAKVVKKPFYAAKTRT